ncbi:hypothetical protein [Streptomyces chrestomyceticus]|uniref:Uncharacterized protein n=1 Tax=Streptomyces chrestomyceticus TaxID=68185 RepID=A0ABU7X598_9ACTN
MKDRHDIPTAATARALHRESTLDKPTLENCLEHVLPGGYQHTW